jgi:hypothetical protein
MVSASNRLAWIPSPHHLRASPQFDGTVEFRYIDTHIKSRQWSRTVPPEAVIGRFEAFLDQLHWIAR